MISKDKPYLPIPLMVFTAIYFLGACVLAFTAENEEFILYILVIAVLIVVIVVVHRRSNLSRALLWCFSIWGLLHMAGGLVSIPKSWPYNEPHNVLYSLWFIPNQLKYDQVVHAYGFGITTWMCWQALRNGVQKRYGKRLSPTFGLVVLCVVGGMGFGAFNEVVEFIATLILPQTNVGDYMNTGWDLVYNAIGAVSMGLIIYCKGQGKQPSLELS